MSPHTLNLMDAKAPKSQIAMLKVCAKNVVHQTGFLPEPKSGSEVCPMNSSGHAAMNKRKWFYKTGKSDVIYCFLRNSEI